MQKSPEFIFSRNLFMIVIIALLIGGAFGAITFTKLTFVNQKRDFAVFKQDLIAEIEHNSKKIEKYGSSLIVTDYLEDEVLTDAKNENFISELSPDLQKQIEEVYKDVRDLNMRMQLYKQYSILEDYYAEKAGLTGSEDDKKKLAEYSELADAFQGVPPSLANSDVPDNMLTKIAQSDVPDNMLSLLTALKAMNGK